MSEGWTEGKKGEEQRGNELTSRVETAHRVARRPEGGMASHDGLRPKK